MINCNYQPIDEFDFFLSIVEAKYNPNKTNLLFVLDRVEEAYDVYLNDFSALCLGRQSTILEIEIDEINSLRDCYTVETAPITNFKANYLNNQPAALKTLCPYCMMDRPLTWDHYIGKARFPEYSVLTKNLLKCCWACNHKKMEKWLENNERVFINFYDDSFLQYNFLTADLVLVIGADTPSVEYRLFKPIEVSDADYDIIISHFEFLNLLEEYNLKANSKISSEVKSIQQYLELGISEAEVVDILQLKYEDEVLTFGYNYWDAIIYRTIAENINMIQNL